MASDRECRGVSCSDCGQFHHSDGLASCALRGVAIDGPEQTFCANHPACGELDERDAPVPVGPVLLRMDGGTRVIEDAPDSTRIRDVLLAIVDESDKRSVAELTPREEIALWQLGQWRERRSFVVQDKISGEPMLPGARTETETEAGAAEGRRRPIGRFVSAARRARVVSVLLMIGIALSLAGLVSGEMQVDFLERASAGGFTPEEAEANDVRHGLIASVGVIVFLLSAVAFLMWIYRSYANLRPLGARAVRHSPVWAVVVWFIPFANLVLPYTVAKEIAEKSAGSDDRPMGGLVLAWWLAYLAKAVVGWNKRALRVPRSETVSIADIIDATRADQLSELVSIGAAALTILVVRGIEQRQAGRPDLIAAFD